MRLALFLAVPALALAGCTSDVVGRASVTYGAPAASAASPCAPAPQFVQAPAAYTIAAPTGVEFVVGPREHARAALAMPPRATQCLVNGAYKVLTAGVETAHCFLESFVPPEPVPSQRAIYGPTPAAAGLQWVEERRWVPAPRANPSAVPCPPRPAPPPAPPIASGSCSDDGNCDVPADYGLKPCAAEVAR